MASVLCLCSPPPLKLSSSKVFSLSTSLTTVSSLSSPSNPKTSSARGRYSKPTEAPSPTSTTLNTIVTSISVPPKKVLVPIGFGTEEMEAVIIIDVLRRAGAEVVVASVEPQLEIEAAGGTRLVADTSISACTTEIFDLVALPTTCHPAFMDKLPTFWAVKSNIQVSGELTTSRGPGTSFEFALCLVDQLFGESIAKLVGELLMTHTVDDTCRSEEFNKVEWSVDHKPRVLIPVANGSEEIEVATIVDILRRAKVDVVVASIEKSVQVLASQGIKIVADKLIDDAAESIYDLIILPGEIAGAERLRKSKVLKKLLQEQDADGRIYGAVCSSLSVLKGHGLLKGKRAIAHPSVVTKLTDGVVSRTKVVIDGRLITSRGLATVTDFALAIVSKLFGHARARSVAEGLVFDYPRSLKRLSSS